MAARRKKSSKSSRSSTFRKKKLSFKNRAIIIILSTAVFLISLTAIVYYASINYIQSDGFRADLEEQLANKTQAKFAHIPNKLILRDDRIDIPTVSLGRRDMIQDVTASGIEMHLNKDDLYDRLLHIPKLYINKVKADVDLNRLGKALPSSNTTTGGSGGFLAQFTPNRYQLDQLICRDLSAYISYKDNSYALTRFKCQALPASRADMSSWVVDLSQGWLSSPFELIQKCRVESARISIQPDGYILDDCRILLSPGDIQLDAAYSTQSKAWTADIKSNKANVGTLLNDSWKAKLHGELFADLHAKGDKAGLRALSGKLKLQETVLEALPFLNDYKKGNSYPYRHMKFEIAQCQLTYPYERQELQIANTWLFDQIEVESEGKLRIEGQVLIGDDGTLGGSLSVGIPTAVVEAIAIGEQGALGQIFNGGNKSGYTWLRINLSGTVDKPQQDLSIRLSSLAKAKLLRGADDAVDGVFSLFGLASPQAGEPDGKNTKQNSLIPSSDSATDLLERGSDAAKGVLESIF